MHTGKLVFIILAIGGLLGVLSGLFSSCTALNKADVSDFQHFEFTVWADPDLDSSLWSIPIVQISEREATKASTVLLRNEQEILPFAALKNRRFHVITLGEDPSTFLRFLNYYTSITHESVSRLESVDLKACELYSTVILVLRNIGEEANQLRAFVDQLKAHTELVVVNFDDYKFMQTLVSHETLLQAPNDGRYSQEISAQMLFGGVEVVSRLPEEMAQFLQISQSKTTAVTRLGYADPEYVGISSDSLAKIEKIVQEAIAAYAMPGCQVLVAKEGQVIYNRSFGYHTYARRRPVKADDLYDLASITKVAATTLATMKLYDRDSLRLDQPLHRFFQDPTYIPRATKVYDTLPRLRVLAWLDTLAQDSFALSQLRLDTLPFQDSLYLVGKWVRNTSSPRRSRVFDVPLKDLLTHTSGLQASLPIVPYKQYLGSNLYSPTANGSYQIPVAEHFYMHNNYLDSLWNMTKSLHRDSARYLYSCVNMMLMQRVVDSINQQSIPDFLAENYYQDLGLQTMCYTPREIFSEEKLIPTASDRWRGQLLCGTVHDPMAALMGGISGNAGLFSNAHDLGILGQMLLNKGNYGGQRFLSDSTVSLFTARQRGHRGFGFDKPPRNTDYIVAESASFHTYGHTGFTGTCFWVDPEHDLVFVFLSNRIHPSVNNWRLNELQVRQRIHQVIYDALGVPSRDPQPSDSRARRLLATR